jgi:hypothetical protein
MKLRPYTWRRRWLPNPQIRTTDALSPLEVHERMFPVLEPRKYATARFWQPGMRLYRCPHSDPGARGNASVNLEHPQGIHGPLIPLLLRPPSVMPLHLADKSLEDHCARWIFAARVDCGYDGDVVIVIPDFLYDRR